VKKKIFALTLVEPDRFSDRFGELFLLHLRLLIAMDASDMESIVRVCESCDVSPFNHLVAFEIAKYFDGKSEPAKAHRMYAKCIKECPRTGLDRDTLSLRAFAFSLMRIGQMQKNRELIESCISFVKESEMVDEDRVIDRCNGVDVLVVKARAGKGKEELLIEEKMETASSSPVSEVKAEVVAPVNPSSEEDDEVEGGGPLTSALAGVNFESRAVAVAIKKRRDSEMEQKNEIEMTKKLHHSAKDKSPRDDPRKPFAFVGALFASK
jgi:hypothetical protein